MIICVPFTGVFAMISSASGKMQKDIPLPYDLTIGSLFSEAWQRVKGAKATYWQALFTYFLIHIALIAVIGSLLSGTIYISTGSFNLQDPAIQNYFSIGIDLVFLLIYPLLIGLYYLGIRRAAGMPMETKMIFNPYQRLFRIIGTLILTYLCLLIVLFIGFFIYGILIAASQSYTFNILSFSVAAITLFAGIYLAFGFMFAPILVFEKQMGIFKAMRASLYGFSQHWFKIIILSVVMVIIMTISAIPLLIGYIWTIPMALNLFGALYRTVFGVEQNH
jgi:hypothetical protein